MRKNKGNHYTIAIMTGSIQSDYAQEMMRGFYAGAREEDVNIVLLMGAQIPSSCTDIMVDSLTGDFRYQFNSIYDYTHFIKPDAAIIVYGALDTPYADWTKESFLEKFKDIPCLMVEDQSFNDKVPDLTADNYSGMRACMKHLIVDHKYEKIVFLSGPKGNYDAEERLRAYRDCMREHDLPITDDMIAYGNFTDNVDSQIIDLMDHNPGLEAIVCADDVMASACYRVCAHRNLIIGSDIAITGFDDTSLASTMNPPLTSVSQNNFMLSYEALKRVVAMCRGEKITSDTMPTELRRRCSCGCAPTSTLNMRYIPYEELGDFIEAALSEMIPYLFSSVSYQKDREHLEILLTSYCFYLYETIMQEKPEEFQMKHLMDILKEMIAYPYFSKELLMENLLQFLQILLANSEKNETERLLVAVASATQQCFQRYNIEKLKEEIYISNRKAWFVPMFTRDLASEAYLRNPQEIFIRVMSELKKISVKSTYFFFFDKTIGYVPDRWLELPQEMRLVAYYDEYDMRYYPYAEQPVFSGENGIASFVDGQEMSDFIPMVLFSQNRQYGIMLCEADGVDCSFLQICSVQLGSLFHFMEIDTKERQAQEQLENSLQVIREQNRILSFLSEYDELTKLLNRRGFIERALALYERSAGKRAFLIFGDLDHLKEINDRYGHAEGDVAIVNIADRFTTILPPSAVIGRIGGDEFVAFVLTDEEQFELRIRHEFAELSKQYNATSDKPYYIDSSVGVYEFICNPQEDFNEMMKESDRLLYSAKALRRKTVQKSAEE